MLRQKLLSMVAVVSLLWAGFAWAQPVPGYAQVVSDYRSSDVLIRDHAGVLLDRIRANFQERRGDWIALDDISPALQRAVLHSEDQRFYDHGGIDWQAVAAAAWGNMVHQQHRGASTISMQLVGFLDASLLPRPSRRSVVQKLDQAWQARALDAAWTKSEILEAYLNLAAYRGELVGIDALSRVMFQKHASGLDAREAALAAVLLRGPNARQAVLVRRACSLLTDMGRPDECRGLGDFTYSALQRRSATWADHRSLAPHYSQWLMQQLSQVSLQGIQSINTTLDADLQRFVLHSIDGHIRALSHANVRDAAVVVLDNDTGEVLSYVGSSTDWSSAAYVDHARALRQAGSTLKPFLYAQAIAQQRITTVSLLDDSPLNLPTGNGLYIPQNYDKQFSGWASVRTALAASLNIPAVRVLMMVGPQPFARVLRQLGLPLNQSGDFYGYSLALGSADITLLTLTNAYRTLANQGRYSDLRLLADNNTMESPMRQVLAADASWIVGDILSDRQARTATFGLDSPLSTPFWSAVKTGTSKDMRDNWCMGWSQRYTVGVWVGNSSGASMQHVSGVSGAGPIWHDIMLWLHRSQPSVQPPMPESVTRSYVSFQDDIEAARHDVFLGDTAVSRVNLAASLVLSGSGIPSILTPADGAIFALDPDIPPANQQVALRATNLIGQGSTQVFWQLNDQPIGQGAAVDWAPLPGRHTLRLLNEQGKVLQQVSIEVRGAQAK